MEKHEVERAIMRAVSERSIDDVPLVVGVGKSAASKKIDAIVELLESEMSNDEKLVKSMRVVRDVLLGLYHDTEHREAMCMLSCSCQHDGEHHQWPSYAAGCFTQGCENGSRIAGRVWDLVEFLRLHNDYANPRRVAEVVVGALKTLSSEFRHKEEGLLKAVEKYNQVSQ